MPRKPDPRRLVYMPVDEVPDFEGNPKGHTIPDIKASMRRHGYTTPVEVDERTGSLVSGHGRKQALIEMRADGEDPPEGVVVVAGGWHVPVVRGWASKSDEDAAAYVIGANQLTIGGGWQEQALADLLAKVASSGFDGTGFTAPNLEDLLAKLSGPPSLDDLADTYGDPDPMDLWPVIRIRVPQPLRERFAAALDAQPGDTEHDQLAALLDKAGA